MAAGKAPARVGVEILYEHLEGNIAVIRLIAEMPPTARRRQQFLMWLPQRRRDPAQVSDAEAWRLSDAETHRVFASEDAIEGPRDLPVSRPGIPVVDWR